MLPTKHALKGLASARDEAKVRLHLLSLDARQRWQTIEDKLDSELKPKAKDLTRSFKRFVQPALAKADGLFAPASTIMTSPVRTSGPHDLLNHAAQILWETNCGALPVVSADGTLGGIVTDRDICMALYTQGEGLSSATVARAMSADVYSCAPDDTIGRVLEIMRSHQVRRVPVVDSRGHVQGIVALADVARYAGTLRAGRAPACRAVLDTLAAISAAPR